MDIKELIKKHTDNDGKLNQEAFEKEIKEEQGKVFVSREDFNVKNNELKTANTTLETLKENNRTNEDLQNEIKALNDEVNNYKTKDLKTRIAMEHKIPFELAGRLSGETEEEIKADAESLSEFIAKKPTLPLGSTEPEEVEEKLYSNQARIIDEQYKSE
jgi:DNA repair exonuclease SbcCD nuclease subunit